MAAEVGDAEKPTLADALVRMADEVLAARKAARESDEANSPESRSPETQSPEPESPGSQSPEKRSPETRTSGADRADLVVSLGPDPLNETHTATLEDGGRVSAETLRRLACDCGLTAIARDEHGHILDIGRKTRRIPPALRRAVMARDGGCAFPGCTHDRFIDVHHAEHSSADQEPSRRLSGGVGLLHGPSLLDDVHIASSRRTAHQTHGAPTCSVRFPGQRSDGRRRDQRGFLVALCTFHHRLLHEDGWRVRLDVRPEGGGDPTFLRPEGSVLEPACAAAEPPADPLGAFEDDHAALAIDDETGLTGWDGTRPDYSACVELVCAADDAAARDPDLDLSVAEWLAKHGSGWTN